MRNSGLLEDVGRVTHPQEILGSKVSSANKSEKNGG